MDVLKLCSNAKIENIDRTAVYNKIVYSRANCECNLTRQIKL
jgi:hypothetical protein